MPPAAAAACNKAQRGGGGDESWGEHTSVRVMNGIILIFDRTYICCAHIAGAACNDPVELCKSVGACSGLRDGVVCRILLRSARSQSSPDFFSTSRKREERTSVGSIPPAGCSDDAAGVLYFADVFEAIIIFFVARTL